MLPKYQKDVRLTVKNVNIVLSASSEYMTRRKHTRRRPTVRETLI